MASELILESKLNNCRTHIHIPTPGDHYSPATGSAVPTVIYELSRCHIASGGESQIIVHRGTRHDYPVGECIEVEFPPLPTRNQKGIDAVLARLRLPRIAVSRVYQQADNAINEGFRGTIFVHNAPAAIPHLKKRYPEATLCLWAHNVLFQTYATYEVDRVAAYADRLICVSHFIADDLRQRLTRNAHKIRVVHNGVDTDRFHPADSQRSPTKADVPLIMYIGRIVPEKGIDLLLKAAAKLYQKKHRFRVAVVGSSNFDSNAALSPYERQLRELATSLGDCVEFRPFVDRAKIIEVYQEASIFCAPSNWDDPCPLIVLEGMACGVPTVASRRGGIPEEGQNALLYFDPPDVSALAERLAGLIDDLEARKQWGKRARCRAEEMTWSNQYQVLCAALAD